VRLKLDENIGRRGIELLREAGHDTMTAREQKLQGSPDEVIFDVCVRERRTLITLDRDFGQTLRFPPTGTSGIVILDPGPRATAMAIANRLREFLSASQEHSAEGALWIVEPGRVRVHLNEQDD
jgi:predicted nuclease of predicted toxin-antitoxin system